MKRAQVVFTRNTYVSKDDGAVQIYTHDESLCDVLGQAKDIIFQFVGSRLSTNARVTVLTFHGSDPNSRPSEVGFPLGTAEVITTLRPNPFNRLGPFQARVEVQLHVDESGTPANFVEADCALYATLTLEE